MEIPKNNASLIYDCIKDKEICYSFIQESLYVYSFIQESLYVRDRSGTQTPYQIHVYISRFLLHDFIFQTSI